MHAPPAVAEPQVGLHSRASTRGKSEIPINNRIAFLAMLLAVEDFLIIQLPLSGSVRPTSARFAMVLSPTKERPPQRNHPMSAGNVENPAGHGHHYFDFADRTGLEPLGGMSVAFVVADLGFAAATVEVIVHLDSKHAGKQTTKHGRHNAFLFSGCLNFLAGLLSLLEKLAKGLG